MYTNLNNYQKFTFIFQNLQILIGIIGIFGNTLSFIVFLRKPFIKHSYAFYFRILAVIDSLLLIHIFRHWSRIVLKVDIDLFGPNFCRFDDYSAYIVGSMSIWLKVLILFDRLVRVNYPNHYKIIKSNGFHISSIAIIFIYCALIHLIVPINIRIGSVKRSNDSIMMCYLPHEILGANFMIVIANLFISSFLTAVLNYKLISFIYTSRKRLRHKLHKQRLSAVKDRKFAISSIAISLVSFFCQLAFGISTLIAVNMKLSSDQIQAVFIGSLTLTLCSNASVFFVNLFMNSIFYGEFLNLLGIRKAQYVSS